MSCWLLVRRALPSFMSRISAWNLKQTYRKKWGAVKCHGKKISRSLGFLGVFRIFSMARQLKVADFFHWLPGFIDLQVITTVLLHWLLDPNRHHYLPQEQVQGSSHITVEWQKALSMLHRTRSYGSKFKYQFGYHTFWHDHKCIGTPSILGVTMINLTTPLWSINWLVQELTPFSIWDFVFCNIDVIFWGSHYLRWRSAKVQRWSIQNVQKWSPLISALWWSWNENHILCKKMTVVVPYSDMVFHTCFQPSLKDNSHSLRYLSDFADEFQLEKLTPPSTRLCLHNGSTLPRLGRERWMARPPNGRSPRPVEPLNRSSLARQSPVFEGCDLKWKTLFQLLWRCLECMVVLLTCGCLGIVADQSS